MILSKSNEMVEPLGLNGTKGLDLGCCIKGIITIETILRWNVEHVIPLFRMGQALIPFASHPQFPHDWVEEHGGELRRLGKPVHPA